MKPPCITAEISISSDPPNVKVLGLDWEFFEVLRLRGFGSVSGLLPC